LFKRNIKTVYGALVATSVLALFILPACEIVEDNTGSQNIIVVSDTPNFVATVQQVKPSVTSIDVESTSYDSLGRPYTQHSAGSGWVYSKDGYIVTNSHVVYGADSIFVTLDDGRIFSADEVYMDIRTDLTVLKIDAFNLPALTIGDSSTLLVGLPVAAIGNSLGLGISMTGGWVSRLGASITFDDDQTLYGLVETDAAINPGNSGGPLVNIEGEVIGITSAKLVDVDIEGVGYAISINSAVPIIDELIANGYVVRPYLGVSGMTTVTPSLASYYGLSVEQGVYITSVLPDSPADTAGLQGQDIITTVNGVALLTAEQLINAIHDNDIGDTLAIEYIRDGQSYNADVTLSETPNPSSA